MATLKEMRACAQDLQDTFGLVPPIKIDGTWEELLAGILDFKKDTKPEEANQMKPESWQLLEALNLKTVERPERPKAEKKEPKPAPNFIDPKAKKEEKEPVKKTKEPVKKTKEPVKKTKEPVEVPAAAVKSGIDLSEDRAGFGIFGVRLNTSFHHCCQGIMDGVAPGEIISTMMTKFDKDARLSEGRYKMALGYLKQFGFLSK